MPIDFPSSPTIGQQYTFGGATYVYSSQGVWATAGVSAIAVINGSPQGRLTLQTATPVMTTTQSAKTTIYYTPYVGNKVPIYDGTSMVMTTFAELSVATTDTTKSPAAIGASKVNDWFVWSDAGTIRIGHGPDWTSDTVRSAGTALVMVNGVLLNNASITNGPAASSGTYVGTTRSNASSQLDWIYGAVSSGWTAGFFGVWNAYNRVDIASMAGDSISSWTYGTTVIRAAGGNTNTARVSFITGLNEDAVSGAYSVAATANASAGIGIGVGLDTTTAFSGTCTDIGSGLTRCTQRGEYHGFPGIGFHYISANEWSAGTVTQTFWGTGSGAGQLNGLSVDIRA